MEEKEIKKLIIDGKENYTRQSLHAMIAETLEFPEWYGKNLDALYDCLSDIFDPVEIVIKNLPDLENSLGQYATTLRRMLTRIADNKENITLITEQEQK